MYMQQLLCLVTADYNRAADLDALTSTLRTRLDAAFKRLRFVHFACLAVLPGRPDAPDDSLLLLELAIDDGIDPQEAVRRLVDAAPDALWALYESGQQPPEGPGMRLRNRLALLADTARAAGGFVGLRDRTVVQVRAEARWFLVARRKLPKILARLRRSGHSVGAAELVQGLKAEMARDPGSVAMNSPPPRSTWRIPRPPILHLAMVLAWLVVPIPLVFCLLALVGWFVHLVVMQEVLETSVLTLGGSAAVISMLLLLTIYGVFRLFSISVIVALAAVLAMILFYAALVAGYLSFAEQGLFGSGMLLLPLALLGVLLALWLVWRPVPGTPFSRPIAAVLGALVSAYLVGAAWNRTVGLPGPLPWALAAYLLPLLAAMLLIWRSSAARWYFAFGAPLILVLLIVQGLAFHWTAASRDLVWDAQTLGLYVGLGALAVVALALLAAIVSGLLALLHLRAPFAPLGVPLIALLALLLIGYCAVCAAAHWLLPIGPDPFRALGHWSAYAWIGLSLALAGALLLALRWLVVSALPSLEEQVRRRNRRPARLAFEPFPTPKKIVENEAALFNAPGHMISLTDVRGARQGWRWLALWLWLHVVGEVGYLVFTKGLLGTASGIKFGHWHLVDDGRRLLFLSNFDGDFGGYLDEFINGTSQGINLIWRWTHLRSRAASGNLPALAGRGFPETNGLAFAGCHREQEFKAYARASMLPHLYLYQAYAESNENIERNTQLRAALAGERSPENDDLVLRTLQS